MALWGANVFEANTRCYSVRTRLGFNYRTIPQPNGSDAWNCLLLVVYVIPNGIGGQGAKYWLSLSTGEIFVSPNLAFLFTT